jgi:integrase
VFEACALRVRDIDSAADRMCIRVENGKGAKTRYTLLELLRAYVRKTKSRDWLFCARGGVRACCVKHSRQSRPCSISATV